VKNPFIIAECERLGLPLNKIETPLPETYSQDGEDLIVESLLLSIISRTAPVENIFYIEIGANHPIQTSNTYLFCKKYNAYGVLVEADPELIPMLQKTRPLDEVIQGAVTGRRTEKVTLNVADAKELSSVEAEHIGMFQSIFPDDFIKIVKQIEVKNIHIQDLLAPYDTIMYLSIDVEGLDLEVLQAIDFTKRRPWIISCEPSTRYKQNNAFQMYKLMFLNEYTLVAKTDFNLIFADKKYLVGPEYRSTKT
jgi:FkbM family methyltransferase